MDTSTKNPAMNDSILCTSTDNGYVTTCEKHTEVERLLKTDVETEQARRETKEKVNRCRPMFLVCQQKKGSLQRDTRLDAQAEISHVTTTSVQIIHSENHFAISG